MIPAIPAIPSIGSALSAGASLASAATSAASTAGSAAATAATGAASTGATTAVAPSTGTAGSSFSDLLGNAIDSLNGTQQTATDLSLQAAAGQASIADVTVASTEADLETQLVTAVRDKAVTAFNTIMDMQA